MERRYEIVLTFILPNQQEVYAIWDIDLFFTLRNTNNLGDFLMDGDKNGFGVSPIEVQCWIYLNPKLKEIESPMGSEMICIGKKIHLVESFV